MVEKWQVTRNCGRCGMDISGQDERTEFYRCDCGYNTAIAWAHKPEYVLMSSVGAYKLSGLEPPDVDGLDDHDRLVKGINTASDALRGALTGFLDDGPICPNCKSDKVNLNTVAQTGYCRRCSHRWNREDDWSTPDTDDDVKPIVFEEVP